MSVHALKTGRLEVRATPELVKLAQEAAAHFRVPVSELVRASLEYAVASEANCKRVLWPPVTPPSKPNRKRRR